MKKLSWLMSLTVLAGLFMTSCGNDDNSNSGGNVTEIAIDNSKGTYVGTEAGMGQFNIQLASGDTQFQLYFTSDPIADKDLLDAELKSSTYTVSTSPAPYVIKTNSFIKKGDTQMLISSGELNVTVVAENYTVEGILTDESGTRYGINYTGLIDIEPIYETEYEIQNGWYWGDDEYEYPGIGEYMTFFTQGEANSYGELDGDGYHISLSFFDNMAPKAWEAKIPNKTYTASTLNEVGTFHVASEEEMADGGIDYTFATFQYRNATAGVAKEVYITDGSVKVKDNADQQEVRFNLELQDGTRHVGKYVGRVKQGDEYTISTLRADKTVGELSHGYLEYAGRSPIVGKENNRWNIYLYGQNLTADPEYYWAVEGTGEFMRVTIYTGLGATEDIPVGVYPIGDERAGNAGTGGGTEAGLDWGTWYFDVRNDNFANYAPTRTGTVTVAKEGDVYTITVNAVDDRQNRITSGYSGNLTFHNSANRTSKKQNSKSLKVKKSTYGKGKIYDFAKKARISK